MADASANAVESFRYLKALPRQIRRWFLVLPKCCQVSFVGANPVPASATGAFACELHGSVEPLAESGVLACLDCGAQNRVALGETYPNCGRCQKPLWGGPEGAT